MVIIYLATITLLALPTLMYIIMKKINIQQLLRS